MLHIFYVILATLQNVFGLEITKNASAAARTTFMQSQPFIIWGVSLILGWEKLDALETTV